ncbi:peroxisomal membrane 22 kDa (Mpv17/PMP22) family protein [Wolffia australiana]
MRSRFVASFLRSVNRPNESIVRDVFNGFDRQVCVERHSRSFFRSRGAFSKAKEAPSVSIPSSVAAAVPAGASVGGKIGFVGWYLRMLGDRPVATKSVTAGFVFLVADLSAQAITAPSVSFDLVRASRMTMYGVLISGPSLHLWFNFLSRFLPKRDMVNTLKKMVLGQTTYGPFICSLFFSLNAFLQGETSSEILHRLKRDLPPTILNGLVYWPICDFITFRFVPVQLQPLVSNSFSFVWTIYLTYTASLDKPADMSAL